MPGRQVHVVAGGHVGAAFHPAAVAKQRHHALQAQLFTEVSTAYVHAAGGQNVVLAVVHAAPLGRQAHQREVGRTAADVDNQYQLFALDGRLVVEGSGDGFGTGRRLL